MNAITIRPVQPADKPEWETLYAGYAEFYQVEQTQDMRDRVWGWLHDDAATSEGLVAVDQAGALIGLTHFRPYARPLVAATGCFLDDLFVAPAARGSGAAEALIEGVRQIASDRGWGVVRWITAQDNARARRLYDRVASQTTWVTYDIKL